MQPAKFSFSFHSSLVKIFNILNNEYVTNLFSRRVLDRLLLGHGLLRHSGLLHGGRHRSISGVRWNDVDCPIVPVIERRWSGHNVRRFLPKHLLLRYHRLGLLLFDRLLHGDPRAALGHLQ